MMHYQGAVITIKDLSSSKAIREYSHTRTGNLSEVTAYLPFESEYAIHYKLLGSRRRVEILIDGSVVTSNLIISGEGDIERFVDTNKRFKFVRATDGAVADPTSKENGLIEIRLYEELSVFESDIISIKQENLGSNAWDSTLDLSKKYKDFNPVLSYSAQRGRDNKGSQTVFTNCSGDCNIVTHVNLTNNIGATVEGSTSKQVFNKTYWGGDTNTPSEIFRFRLKGTSQDSKRRTIKCPYCFTHNREDADLCIECHASFS